MHTNTNTTTIEYKRKRNLINKNNNKSQNKEKMERNLDLGTMIFVNKNDFLIYKILFEYTNIITFIKGCLLINKYTYYNIQHCHLLKQYEERLGYRFKQNFACNFIFLLRKIPSYFTEMEKLGRIIIIEELNLLCCLGTIAHRGDFFFFFFFFFFFLVICQSAQKLLELRLCENKKWSQCQNTKKKQKKKNYYHKHRQSFEARVR